MAITLPQSAGALYDPYTRALAPGDPTKALDGSAATAWSVGTTSTAGWAVGYAIDLQKLRTLQEVDIQTTTPGFSVEVYGTDLKTPPPSITDARWSHLRNVDAVARTQHISLASHSDTKFRTLLLWITAAPATGDRVRLAEVGVLG